MRSRPAEGRPLPRAHSGGSEGETPAALLFAILVFFLVAFLSAWQLTEEQRALTMIEAGVVSATEIDRMLDDDFDDLQAFVATSGEATFVVPGFPLDIVVTSEEVTNSTQEEFRALLLQRSTAAIYDHGAEAFDASGNQTIGRFSSEGALQFVLNGLTGNWHTLSRWIALVLAFAAAAAALYVLRREDGHRRFVLLGTFTAGAGLMGCIATFALRALIGRFGGDDPFSSDLREIANAALSVPMTNFIVIGVAGAVVAVIGLGLKLANQRFPGEQQGGRVLVDGHPVESEYEYDAPDFGDARN